MSLELDQNFGWYVKVGVHKIKLEKEDLNEDMKKKAREELRETPENVECALKELRKLLTSETDLYIPIDCDEYLIKFLRPCKFYPESTLQQIKRFYTFRKKNPIYCYNLLPENDRNAFKQGLIGFQEIRDNNGSRILVIEAGGKWKPSQCTLVELFRSIQLSLEAAMAEPKTQVGGVVVIFNMLGFSLSHVVQITPSFAKMVVDWIQDCIPIRLKAIHIVNQPYVFNMVFQIFKPFMREKLKQRLHFHGTNYDSLQKHVPKEALQPRFKGTMIMPEMDGGLLCDLFCKYKEEFVLADSYGYKKNGS
ncbi:alpha-tocopherol transfer protein [Arctopsyche grandis]|uniref:alpha-tocopherol transfer protein n=1 Tax=Arctopsyche grandis TaxID=121162 RepID=UPI00406DA36C